VLKLKILSLSLPLNDYPRCESSKSRRISDESFWRSHFVQDKTIQSYYFKFLAQIGTTIVAWKELAGAFGIVTNEDELARFRIGVPGAPMDYLN
jgi:hypothetical protein